MSRDSSIRVEPGLDRHRVPRCEARSGASRRSPGWAAKSSVQHFLFEEMATKDGAM